MVKMKTDMHVNSLAAYYQELERLGHRARAVYEYLCTTGPRTDRETMEGMGFTDMNAVRPRITELIKAGWLHELSDVRCPVTGKLVRVVEALKPERWRERPHPPVAQEVQQELF